MRRSISFFFIGTFLVLAVLPGLQTLFGFAPDYSIDEQRTLAKAPRLDVPAKLLHASNNWFSDHFGFRPLLIRLKGEVDYRVFGISDRVHVGHDGYLFYRNSLDIEKPYIEALLASKEDVTVEGVRRYARALEAAGIRLVLVVNLLGDRFLPDKLPDEVASRRPLRRIDGFIEKLRAIPDLTFVDSTEILQRTASARPIFHRTDFHWNDPAAFPVAEAIVDVMSRGQGLPATVWTHPLEIESRKLSGGIARFMPLIHSPTEESIFVKENWSWPPGFIDKTDELPYQDVTRTSAGTPGLLDPAFFIGDSFMDSMMRCGLSSYFSRSHRLRWAPGMTLEGITKAIAPGTRWVVVQFIETNQPPYAVFGNPGDVTAAVEHLRLKKPF